MSSLSSQYTDLDNSQKHPKLSGELMLYFLEMKQTQNLFL